MYFDAEIVSLGDANSVFLAIEESADGHSGWNSFGTKTYTTISVMQEYSFGLYTN
jgi:hypothetical protein